MGYIVRVRNNLEAGELMDIIREFNINCPAESIPYRYLRYVNDTFKISRDELVITGEITCLCLLQEKHKVFDTAEGVQSTWDAVLTHRRFKKKGVWSWIKENFC